MLAPILLRQDAERIATLTLNAPDKFNALSEAMLAALGAEFGRLARDGDIRVVILQGAGRAFCAGHDLDEMQAARAEPDKGAAAYARLFRSCADVMMMIPALPQPVIASVHGVATAAGCQLAASCDLIVAAETARFRVPGTTIGLFCSTPMVPLARKVPPAVAFELLMTGEFLPAPRARDMGLVNRVVPEARLGEETLALARSIASKLAAAVRIGKSGFYDQQGLGLAEAYDMTVKAMAENTLWPDTEEGIIAFLEKRAPDWPP
jgi:enoyl-CoA hydratase/carnithine racemase